MTSTPLPLPPRPTSSSSLPNNASPRPMCAICTTRYAIYTCPRCATRTCSLPCSAAHKTQKNSLCDGKRDKTAYVPPNKYGWGALMDDYVFLEDVGRKVGEWGAGIVRGRFQQGGRGAAGRGGRGNGGRGRGRGRGRGGNENGSARGKGNGKREVLRAQLEAHEIDMDLLPPGMERHKLNQSVWDPKTQTALLTIGFTFHPPPNPLLPPGHAPEKPYTLLTHRNRADTPLLSLLQRAVSDAGRKDPSVIPAWVRTLACPDTTDPDDNTFTPPQCVVRATTPRAHHLLDATQPLLALLRGTHFVEFPAIDVWEEFRGTVVDAGGAITQVAEPGERERAPKRRKLDRKAGKAIAGLLGGYGSSSDEEEGGQEGGKANGKEKEKEKNGLEMLGGYSGSEDEAEARVVMQAEEGDSDEEGVGELALDPAALVELMRAARGDATW
ncbi:hypothetical protein DFH07DRAFT_878040, partial [Mycena maculata]